MKYVTILAAVAVVTAAVAAGHSQTTRPATTETWAQDEKDFGRTKAQLIKYIQREFGNPIVIDGDLIVGVHRDGGGHVTGVTIHTKSRDLDFNRVGDNDDPGLRYCHMDLDSNKPNLSTADDIDGDGRIDRILLTPPGQKLPNILFRLGDKFLPAEATKQGNVRTKDGRTFKFDLSKHEWIEAK